jgi:hypothetical protein
MRLCFWMPRTLRLLSPGAGFSSQKRKDRCGSLFQTRSVKLARYDKLSQIAERHAEETKQIKNP